MEKKILNKKPQYINEELVRYKKITIISHYNPDGDAIGSCLALYLYLKDLNKDVSVIIPNQIPEFLKWLPGCNDIIIYSLNKKDTIDIINKSEIIVSVDFNGLSRLNQLESEVESSKAVKVLIDHHPNPEKFADIIYSDISVSSTAELVFEIIHQSSSKNTINKEIAICLYTGILTDSVNFRHNISSRTFEIISILNGYNIDIEAIYSNTYDHFSFNRMQLLGYALNKKLKHISEYNTAYICLSKSELDFYNFVSGDSEGFVNYPLSIKGVKFSALFMEIDDHIKISFRSKGDFAVNDFSNKHFNGGGHRNAAGGKSFTSMDETLKSFESLLLSYKDKLQTI